MEDSIKKSADRVIDATQKTTSFLEQFMTYILLLLMIGGLFFVTFYNIVVKDGLTQDVILATLVLIIANIGGFSLFNPKGKDLERKRNKSYIANTILWSKLSTTVQDNKSKEFRVYCRTRTDEKREERVEEYIKKAGFDVDNFEKEIKTLNDIEFKKLMKSKDEYKIKNYNRKQKKFLKKARRKGKIKVKKIDPTIILLGTTSGGNYEVGQKEKISVDQKIFISKISKVIITSLIISSVFITPTEAVGWAMVGNYLLRVANVLSSAVSGLFAGILYIKVRNDRIKGNIWFLKEFHKEHGLDKKEEIKE